MNRKCRHLEIITLLRLAETWPCGLTETPVPRSMAFIIYCFTFYTIQTLVCYVGCLMTANTWTYISLYIRNTAILENKKSVCIFPHQLVNTCDLHLHFVNYAKCSHNPSKDASDWSVVADLKTLLNFKVNFLKIWLSQTSPFVDI